MSARDDYRPGNDGHYEAMCDEIDKLRAELKWIYSDASTAAAKVQAKVQAKVYRELMQ